MIQITWRGGARWYASSVMTKPDPDSRCKLLLVEDNPLQVTLVREALALDGAPYVLEVASSGEEALHMLKGSTSGPDLVLLDLGLPGMSGLEVLQRLRSDEMHMCTPVVILSSSEEPGDIARCYQSGANAYTVKPVGLCPLRDLLRQVTSFWFEIAVLPGDSLSSLSREAWSSSRAGSRPRGGGSRG